MADWTAIFVQGHVDGKGNVVSVSERGSDRVVRLKHLQESDRFIVEKGSIAVDGVSLTVTACGAAWFEVMLIPHTLRVTTLGERVPGDGVNLGIRYTGQVFGTAGVAQAGLMDTRLDSEKNPTFSTVEAALEDIRSGKFVIVVDDETVRTKAISRSPQRRLLPRPSISWPVTAAGSSACQ